MSTNKTENLNLHSWVPTDRFSMSEFNENFAAIDENAGVLAAADAANASAISTLRTSLNTTSAAIPKIVTGTYAGNATGTTGAGSRGTQTVKLGFKPKAVLVTPGKLDDYDSVLLIQDRPMQLNVSGSSYLIGEITSTGFKVGTVAYNASIFAPNLNQNNTTYSYLAIG